MDRLTSTYAPQFSGNRGRKFQQPAPRLARTYTLDEQIVKLLNKGTPVILDVRQVRHVRGEAYGKASICNTPIKVRRMTPTSSCWMQID